MSVYAEVEWFVVMSQVRSLGGAMVWFLESRRRKNSLLTFSDGLDSPRLYPSDVINERRIRSLIELHFLDLIQHIIGIAFSPRLPYNRTSRSDIMSPDENVARLCPLYALTKWAEVA